MSQCTCGRSSSYPYCDSTHKTNKHGILNKISEKMFYFYKNEETEKNIFGIKQNKIAEVKNFISPGTRTSVINFFDNLDKSVIEETGFYGAMIYNLKNHKGPVNGLEEGFWDILLSKVQESMKCLYGIDFINTTYAIQVWPKNSEATLHSDSTDISGNIKVGMFKKFKFSSIIYLNDNYEGGQIVFPEHDISISPKSGSMLMFSGGVENLHKVEKVLGNNNRYTISISWDTADSVYSNEEVNLWESELLKWKQEVDDFKREKSK